MPFVGIDRSAVGIGNKRTDLARFSFGPDGQLGGVLGRNIPGVMQIQVGIVGGQQVRSEEHTSELQSLMRISSAVFCLKKKNRMMFLDYLHYMHMLIRNCTNIINS